MGVAATLPKFSEWTLPKLVKIHDSPFSALILILLVTYNNQRIVTLQILTYIVTSLYFLQMYQS